MPTDLQPAGPDADDSIAARVLANKELVLRRFMEEARRRLPAAASLEDSTLRDTLPELIDIIAEALSSDAPDEVLASREPVAREHGRDRANQDGYDLAQVIDEFVVFRQVLFDAFEADGRPLPRRTRNVLLDAVQLFIRASASEFSDRSFALHAGDVIELRDAHAQIARQLDQSEERFRQLVESVNDYAICTLDRDGYIKTWNAGAQRMKGYTSEEIIGRHFSILYPADGRLRDEPGNHLRIAVAVGRFRGEGRRMRKSGEIYDADVLLTPMYDDGKLIGFSKVVQDLSERNALIQERDLSRLDAERLKVEAEYRDRFVSLLTHDLRSPLSAALTTAELIERKADDPAKVRAWAQRISRAVKRIDKMIRNLLDATRLRSDAPLQIDVEPCDVKKIADDAVAEHTVHHGDRFRVVTSGDTHGFWSCDGLRRVLDNLLSNAVKYGQEDAPITIGIKRADERMLVSVHNHGISIPTEEQPKLFNAYHRAPSALGKAGWGLGLSLVRGLVEAHGGMVKVESYPNEGTTFTIDIPVDARSGDHVPIAGEVE